MILLLGASGYVGQAFGSELYRRGYESIPLSRRAIDYTNFNLLFDYVRRVRPAFIINAAGYAGNPDLDDCELARNETLSANAILPQTIARVCLMTNTPWGHVSSGAIYSGAKVIVDGRIRIEKNLDRPDLRRLFAVRPECFFGFTEWDEPNFSFRCEPHNFYSGTKALAEELIRGLGAVYVWRPGILFDEREESRNLLWQIQQSRKVYDSVDSYTHAADFVRACLNLWERQSPFGIYNIVNPGAVTTRQVAEMFGRIHKPERRFQFWKDDEEFHRSGTRANRSHCILDESKLQAAGVEIRPVQEALEEALCHWRGLAAGAVLAQH